MLDKIIFGDNQFLGINHRSLNKSKSQETKFDKVDDIYKTLEYVNSIGIKSFMFTTHNQFEPVLKMIKNNTTFTDFKLIPCIPYGHKYADAMVELGMLGTVRKFLPRNPFTTGLRGLKTLLLNDPVPTMKLLIDSEMKMLKGMNVQAIFIQNAVTDLLLGLNMSNIFIDYINYVVDKYNIKVGFITMNFAKLHHTLIDTLKVRRPLICSNINKIGFRMNPSQEVVENILSKNTSDNIAMSIFASGAIKPEKAVDYLNKTKGVNSVLFGASTREHIYETKKLLDDYLAN
ncbi:hypothetical protein ACFL0J_07770 [Candidatus Neomarinimicrobiota bacterium]